VHQRLRHVTSAVRTEVALGVGQIQIGNCAHGLILTQRCEDAKNYLARGLFIILSVVRYMFGV
jgi:hypothetical protein